ncbi:hypothetical protein GQ457_01G034940 [Hibiscus cannabinus]
MESYLHFWSMLAGHVEAKARDREMKGTSLALGLILDCTKAIEDGDLKSADRFLHRILNVADKELSFSRSRVVKYFAEALVCRAYGLPLPSSHYTLVMDHRAFCCYDSCYVKDVIGNAIKNALPLMGPKQFHLVDFSLPSFWSVLNTLPSSHDDPSSVRISLILSPIWEDFIHRELEMKHIISGAKGPLDIKLEGEPKVVYASSLDESELDFKRGDEATVVFYNLKLNKLLKDAKAMKRELVRLREINPAVVFMLELYVNHNDFNCFTYLEDSFQYYSDLSGDGSWSLSGEFRWMFNMERHEGQDLIRQHKTLPEWQQIFLMGGFRQLLLEDSQVARSPQSRETMHEENGCLVFCHKQRPMFFLSAWKPQVEDEHSSCNPSSHNIGPGFNSNSPLDTTIPPLQPHQPFTEGSTLNKLAAFAEIYDILKDLCHKYDISLAIAWDTRVNDMNGNMSHPYKNRSLLIRHNSCYVKDWSSYVLLREYEPAKYGSPFVARKALESSDGFYFEPSVRNVRVGDVELLPQTTDKGPVAAFAICLRNCYTSNEIYVVEFCWGSEKPEYFASAIFDELKSMKKKFITLNVQDTEVGKQIPPVTLVHSSSHVAIAPSNRPEGSHDQNKRKRKMDEEDSNAAKVPRNWNRNEGRVMKPTILSSSSSDDDSDSEQSDEFQSSSDE